jgi:hypothetical protein
MVGYLHDLVRIVFAFITLAIWQRLRELGSWFIRRA